MVKAKKGGDFKVIKKKVGKKLKPANATSTAFQSRQIVLREQSVVQEVAATEAVSARGLTVEQLSSQTRHHNSRVRREAFQQLKQLVEAHTDHGKLQPRLKQSLQTHVEKLIEGMFDDDGQTRQAFVELLHVIQDVLQASHFHSSINMIFSTLTGPGLSRRLDGTRVVEVLQDQQEFRKQLSAHGPRLVKLYCDLGRCVLRTTTSALALVPSNLSGSYQQSGRSVLNTNKEHASKKMKRMKSREVSVASQETQVLRQQRATIIKAIETLLDRILDSETYMSEGNLAIELLDVVLELFKAVDASTQPEVCFQSARAMGLCMEKLFSKFEIAIPSSACNLARCLLSEKINLLNSSQNKLVMKAISINCACFCKPQSEDMSWIDDCVKYFGELLEDDMRYAQTQVSQREARFRLFCRLIHVASQAQQDDLVQTFHVLLSKYMDTYDSTPEARVLAKEFLEILQLVMLSEPIHSRSVAYHEEWLGSVLKVLWCCDLVNEYDLACFSMGLALLKEYSLKFAPSLHHRSWLKLLTKASPLFCGFASQEVVAGPLLGAIISELEPSLQLLTEVLGFIQLVPVQFLTNSLLKSLCQVAGYRSELSPGLRNVVLETVFRFALENVPEHSNEALVESTLSFSLSVGLSPACSEMAETLRTNLETLTRSKGWPLFELLEEPLTKHCEGFTDSNTMCIESWLTFCGIVMSCEKEKAACSKLLQVFCTVLGSQFWSQGLVAPAKAIELVMNIVSPESVVANTVERLKQSTPQQVQEAESRMLIQWLEVLVADKLSNNNRFMNSPWSLHANGVLSAQVQRLSAQDPGIASNLRILQSAVG